jgi:hypothetical protein
MIRFCQPSDYIHKGRNVWFNPSDVVTVLRSEGSPRECVITLRNGDKFTIDMDANLAAAQINEALKGETK